MPSKQYRIRGGLGIGNLMNQNKALLGKCLWRFPLSQNSLQYSIIRSKYGLSNNGWDSKVVSSGIWTYRNPWKFIYHGRESFLEHTTTIRFWEDKGDSIASLASLNSDCLVSWNLSFSRNLNESESWRSSFH